MISFGTQSFMQVTTQKLSSKYFYNQKVTTKWILIIQLTSVLCVILGKIVFVLVCILILVPLGRIFL